jgi:hypothetical protein
MGMAANAAAPAPQPDLKVLDKLVGTWKISGGQGKGKTTYEWMDGGFFLIQRGELDGEAGKFKYMQIIGHEHSPESPEPSPEITGRLYTSNGGSLSYTCEADDKSMTIWYGPKGSPNVYRGEWSDEGNTLSGEWKWPGGGYKETMTRVVSRSSKSKR